MPLDHKQHGGDFEAKAPESPSSRFGDGNKNGGKCVFQVVLVDSFEIRRFSSDPVPKDSESQVASDGGGCGGHSPPLLYELNVLFYVLFLLILAVNSAQYSAVCPFSARASAQSLKRQARCQGPKISISWTDGPADLCARSVCVDMCADMCVWTCM